MTFWCVFHFVDTGFRKFDRYKHDIVQSANGLVRKMRYLCVWDFVHGTVATKRMSGRKFLHRHVFSGEVVYEKLRKSVYIKFSKS